MDGSHKYQVKRSQEHSKRSTYSIVYSCNLREQTKITHVQDEGHLRGGKEERLGGARRYFWVLEMFYFSTEWWWLCKCVCFVLVHRVDTLCYASIKKVEIERRIPFLKEWLRFSNHPNGQMTVENSIPPIGWSPPLQALCEASSPGGHCPHPSPAPFVPTQGTLADRAQSQRRGTVQDGGRDLHLLVQVPREFSPTLPLLAVTLASLATAADPDTASPTPTRTLSARSRTLWSRMRSTTCHF